MVNEHQNSLDALIKDTEKYLVSHRLGTGFSVSSEAYTIRIMYDKSLSNPDAHMTIYWDNNYPHKKPHKVLEYDINAKKPIYYKKSGGWEGTLRSVLIRGF